MYHTLTRQLADLRRRMQQFPTIEIAQLAGAHPNTVRQIRNGVNLNPTIETVELINRAVTQMEQKS